MDPAVEPRDDSDMERDDNDMDYGGSVLARSGRVGAAMTVGLRVMPASEPASIQKLPRWTGRA